MKYLFLSVGLFLSSFSFSQENISIQSKEEEEFDFDFDLLLDVELPTYIYGKWSFKSIVDEKSMDPKSVEALKQYIQTSYIIFDMDDNYKMELFVRDEGKYDYNPFSEEMVLTSNKGQVKNFEFKRLDNGDAIFKITDGQEILMERTDISTTTVIRDFAAEMKLVAITNDQLARKWFLKEYFEEGLSQLEHELIIDFAKKGYFKYNKDQSFEVFLSGVKFKGTWSLSNENKTLSMFAPLETSIWHVKMIDGNTLEMYKTDGSSYWRFSTK